MSRRSSWLLPVVAACGSSAPPVAPPGDEVANVSPAPRDALLVSIGGDGVPHQLVVVDVGAGTTTEIHREPADGGIGIDDAAWAGDRIVVVTDRLFVVDPAAGTSWTITDRGGYDVVVSQDGRHVAWDCRDDLCFAPVDGSEPPRALGVGDGAMLEPLGWRGDVLVFQDLATVYEVDLAGGPRREVMHVGNLVTVAPDGRTLIAPELGVMSVVALDDGAQVAAVELTDSEEWPIIDQCAYAGAARLACWREDEVVLADWSGNVETLARGVAASAVLGDPGGEGAAFAEDGEVLSVARLGATQHRFELGASVVDLLDWRR